MAINARDRFAKLPEARREKILARADELVAEEMTLAKLREARLRSQAQIAQKLGIKQAAVSRLERRADMYLSTLRELIAAMGGDFATCCRVPRSAARDHHAAPDLGSKVSRLTVRGWQRGNC